MTSSLLFNITTLLYLASMLAFFAALANRTKQFFGTAGSCRHMPKKRALLPRFRLAGFLTI